MRLFVAVTLDSVSCENVGSVISELRKNVLFQSCLVRWISSPNLHLTLKFFGDLDSRRFELLKRVISRPWRQSPFNVSLDYVGVFPLVGLPQVAWLGVNEGSSKLSVLNDELHMRLSKHGFSMHRYQYLPHLTIGRIKRSSRRSGVKIRDILRHLSLPSIRWTVDRVLLYESKISSTGSIYHVKEEGLLNE